MSSVHHADAPCHSDAEVARGALPRWLEGEAARLEALGTSSARWLAAEVRDLAAEARFLSALTHEVFVGRRDAMERGRIDDARAEGRAVGYLEGLADAGHPFYRD